jgi:hypothetical protein
MSVAELVNPTIEVVQEESEEARATTPGAMLRQLRRELPDGSLIEFEESPTGWLKKDGDPRKAPWRAYFYRNAAGVRRRLPSTTTVLDAICPKPGLPPWSEKKGIEGLLAGIQAGLIDPMKLAPEQAVEAVRRLKLGADAAKKLAADRGLNVHAINERYMLTGEGPKFADHPREHHGFIRAWGKAMLVLKPEPVEVESLVVHPERGYAGRLDMRARIGGLLETDDFKTNDNAAIYPGAHYQVNLYEDGAVFCGAEPADQLRVIVLAADGEWDSMVCNHEAWQIDAALAHYRGIKPIDSLCASRNAAQKALRA